MASHTAQSVISFSSHVIDDVAVIDEIQMIADKSRGGHWTNALLGVKAKEVHVCGDSSVINLVKSFAEQCGDSFKVSLLIPVGPCVTCPVSQISNLQNLRNATCWFDSWTGHFFFQGLTLSQTIPGFHVSAV